MRVGRVILSYAMYIEAVRLWKLGKGATYCRPDWHALLNI